MPEWGTFAIVLGVFAAVVAVIWYAKSRGPKTAKGVHHVDIPAGRIVDYPKQVEQPEDDGS